MNSIIQSRTSIAKRGHRRVHSNPSARNHWRGKVVRGEYDAEAPVANFSVAHSYAPPMSPCSTPVRQQISYPSTPKTWSGRSTLSEGSNLDGLHHHHSHHETFCYQDMNHGEPKEQLYRYPDTPKRWSDQWGTCDTRHSRHAPLLKYPLSAPAVCHSWSPTEPYHHPPTLPPRHQFSPAGYRLQPHPADWAPRMSPRRKEYLHSPHRRSYNHTYHPVTQNEWQNQSPCSHDPHISSRVHHLQTAKDVSSSSLSVPALGGETNDSMPTRVLLAPRSRRQIGNHPTRPPKYQASDFAPPPSSSRLSREAISVETATGQRIYTGREFERSDLTQPFRESEASPVNEEKKSDDNKVNSTDSTIPKPDGIFLPSAFLLKPRRCSPYSQGNEDEMKSIESPKIEPLETSSNATTEKFAEKAAIDSVVMSPVRENPKTLMEVPENILTLPISPFGPNDDPD